MFKENDFHWLFTTVVYQQIENSERANQIHRFTTVIINLYQTIPHELFDHSQVIFHSVFAYLGGAERHGEIKISYSKLQQSTRPGLGLRHLDVELKTRNI